MHHQKMKATLIGLAMLAISNAAIAESGVNQNEIVIGRSSSITGMAALMQVSYTQGYEAAQNQINKRGGINGRYLKTIVMDDAFDPKKTLSNAKKLIDSDGVFALFSLNGTGSVAAVQPLIEEKKVPLFGAITGAESLRSKEDFSRYIFHVRAGYADEMEAIVRHVHMLGQANLVVIYQNIPFGKALLNHVEQSLAKRGMKPMGAFMVESDGKGSDLAVAQAMKLKPDSIIIATAGAASVATMKSIQQSGQHAQLYGSSLIGVAGLQKALGAQVDGLVVTQVMPSPFDKTNQLSKDYQEAMRGIGVNDFNYESFEAYTNMRFFAEALKRAGKNLTRQGLIDSIETNREISVGEFSAKYGRANHDGSNYVDITMVTNKPVKFIR
ncbi:MAG TPA: ABC transporter substrate-binding protein [Burkholderiaceae bacterium]|jgi:ABC-type branched-subunit amino acid transport system substrate-binding protein